MNSGEVDLVRSPFIMFSDCDYGTFLAARTPRNQLIKESKVGRNIKPFLKETRFVVTYIHCSKTVLSF